MTSRRNSEEAALDAARELVLDVGVRRTTMTEVARRAGLSRMTLYRFHPDVTSLLADLLTRELGAFVAKVSAEVADLPTARERLVESAVRVVRRLPEEPLFSRVYDVDPELLLPYLMDRIGSSQRAVLDAVLAHLAIDDGSLRRGDPAVTAHVLLLTVQSFVVSARLTSRWSDPEAVVAELRLLLHAYLTPSTEVAP